VRYFKDVFIPSRTRVVQRLYSEHPWIFRVRNFLLNETFKFGVNLKTRKGIIKYTLEEALDGSITVFDGRSNLNFNVFKIPLNLVIHVEEDFLREWVEDEGKLMKHTLTYFVYYLFRMIPKLRLS
jgi:hypothetical protein